MIERGRLVLIGHPVAHSLSPVMQNAALEAAGSALRYEAIDVLPENLESTLVTLRDQNAAGNFTIPHKRLAMKSMQKCTPIAIRAGAVNTFWRDNDGELDGDNTDVTGFASMVNEIMPGMPDGVRVAVIGAGGASAAVITAIESWPGATVSVHARDLARAVAMRMRHSVVVRACSMRDPCLEEANIVVNATPLGLSQGDPHPADLDRMSPDAVVLDLVYAKGETDWVRAAREKGHQAADGLSMLLHQGAAAFERWFGIEPDRTAMWDALRNAAGRD